MPCSKSRSYANARRSEPSRPQTCAQRAAGTVGIIGPGPRWTDGYRDADLPAISSRPIVGARASLRTTPRVRIREHPVHLVGTANQAKGAKELKTHGSIFRSFATFPDVVVFRRPRAGCGCVRTAAVRDRFGAFPLLMQVRFAIRGLIASGSPSPLVGDLAAGRSPSKIHLGREQAEHGNGIRIAQRP